MKRRHLPGLVLAGIICLGADPLPTMEQIQQDFDSQKYPDVLKKLSQVLPLKGQAAQGYDRVALLMLKGETHLRLKQPAPSSEAFSSAAKEATDEKLIGQCNATALLVKRSTNGMYQPKQPSAPSAGASPGRAAPIDIIDPNSRKDAMLALFNDESKTVLAKAESLKKQKSLPPVADGIKQLGQLRALELAATGSDATCKQAVADLGSHANQLMQAELKKMGEQVEKIARQANETHSSQQTRADGTIEVVTSKRGLTSVDQNALKTVINTCKNIVSACDEFAAVLGADGSGFTATSGQSSQLSTRADEVLRADYSPEVRGGSSTPRVGPRPGTPRQPGRGY
jgi:hypothetical protein